LTYFWALTDVLARTCSPRIISARFSTILENSNDILLENFYLNSLTNFMCANGQKIYTILFMSTHISFEKYI